MPVRGISWYEAMAYAKWKGKQLPTIFHWLRAADFNGWYDGLEVAKHSNVGNRLATPWPTRQSGSKISANRYGVYDMTGNVKEWCLNEDQPGTRYALG